MDSKKKKEKSIKNIFTTLWFVFSTLSFFILLSNVASAKIITTYYNFDMGQGAESSPPTVIPSIKMVLRVEENTDLDVSDTARYNIKNIDITGFKNYIVGYDEINVYYLCDSCNIPNLTEDANKSIYNFLCYTYYTTVNAESRKFMKSILMAIINQGSQIYVKENGDRLYLRLDKEAEGNDLVRDNDFVNYVWLYDREWDDRNFYQIFHQESSSYVPFARGYAKESMYFVGNANGNLCDYLSDSKRILSIINVEIENDTEIGKYLKKFKITEEEPESDITECKWWYRENSFNKTENSILIDVGETKGSAQFTFKYTASGQFVKVPSVGDLTAADGSAQYDYSLRYDSDVDTTTLEVHPDYTSGGAEEISQNFIEDDDELTVVNDFYLAVDSVTHAQNGLGNIYVTKFSADSKSENSVARFVYGKMVCSILKEDLNKKIIECGGEVEIADLIIKDNSGYPDNSVYSFAFNPETKHVAFYKKNDDEYVGMNIDLSSMYALYAQNESKTGYGLAVMADPEGFDKTNFKKLGTSVNGEVQNRAALLISNKKVKNLAGESFSYEWTQEERIDALFASLYDDSNNLCFLAIYDLSEIDNMKRGVENGEKIPIDDCTLLAKVSIREWLKTAMPEEDQAGKTEVEKNKNAGQLTGQIDSKAEMTPELQTFTKTLLKYSRAIIMFLILVALIVAAIFAVVDNGDADKRALLKLKIMHIVAGAMVFAVSALIISLGTYYFNKAADRIVATETKIDYDIEGMYVADENWLLGVIQEIINAIAGVLEWIIDFLVPRMLILGGQELDLADMIFSVEEAGGLSLYPYTDAEWDLYMNGYILLTTVAMAIIGIALVKHVANIIINAGNPEKIAMVKQDFMRIVSAILCIVLVPYGIRMMLLLVNSMVLLIPVSDVKFDLNFSTYGLVGSIANIVFLITKLRIFIVFIVRKVMMSFLIIATPVIFSIWAVSNKFRSFGLWLGELVTNAFMQFSYAFIFFFLIIMLSDEQNPFAILLLLTMIMKLADFLRDSLQGLFQQWGGVNETKVAEGVINGAVNETRNVKNRVGGFKKGVGNNLMKASKYFDENQISRGGVAAHNVGAVLAGKYFGVTRERERLSNVKGVFDKSAADKNKSLNSKRDYLDRLVDADPNARAAYDKVLNGSATQEELDEMRRKGGLYSDIASFANSKEEYQNFVDYSRTVDRNIDKLSGMASAMQGASDSQYLEKVMSANDIGTKATTDKYKELKNDYNDLVNDMDETVSKLESGKLDEYDKQFSEEHLKSVAQQVLDKGMDLSTEAVKVSLDVDLGEINTDLKDVMSSQTRATSTLASRFGTYNIHNVEKQEVVKQNLNVINDNVKPGTKVVEDDTKPGGKRVKTSNYKTNGNKKS